MNDFMKSRFRAFGHAFNGVRALWRQPNGKIHFMAAALVLAAGFYFQISPTEWVATVIPVAMVLAAEAFNTSIEVFCDKLHPEIDPKIKRVKDLAAASVLICATGALVVGCIIFIPKIFASI